MNQTRLQRIAGIDFGTSNSSVGVYCNNDVSLLNMANQGSSVPSAIFYDSETQQACFGKQAMASYTQGIEGRLLRSLKSVLGTALIHEKTQIGHRRVAFADIIAEFFGFLKSQLDQQGHASVEHVVLGRPVHFVDDNVQRDNDAQDQLHAIARSVGFRHVEFQLEPIAAALNFERSVAQEMRVMIVDIGGGTADFSVLQLCPRRHAVADRRTDVLGNMGVHIGGTDLDRLLSLHSVMPQLGFGTGVKGSERVLPGAVYFDLATWHRIPLLYSTHQRQLINQMRLDARERSKLEALGTIVDQRLGHALARSVEAAKIELSGEHNAMVNLAHESAVLVDCSISRADMEEAIGVTIQTLLACVIEGLSLAQVKADDISCVFYTGGSSSVPCLQAVFRDMLPHAKHTHGDVFGSVGLGLTMDAARRFA